MVEFYGLIQGVSKRFSVKDQTINILGFGGDMVSETFNGRGGVFTVSSKQI